jgi:hypothetical protein
VRRNLTGRSTRTRTGKAPHAVRGSIRRAAPCRCVPVNSDVMAQAVEMKLASERSRPARWLRPLLSSFAVAVSRPCASLASRTAVGVRAGRPREPSGALRPGPTLRTADALWAVSASSPSLKDVNVGPLSFARRCARRVVCVGISSLRPQARPSHNRSVETDTQPQGAASRIWKFCISRRLAAGCGSPSR